ncbi:MAG: ABC transporter permease [Thermoleophilia bacterium]
MLRFIARRSSFVLLTIIISSLIIFAATQILPGDVASMVLGRFASDEAKEALRHELGLDRPLVVQYGSWLVDFVRGDWGTSISAKVEVRPYVFERLGNSAVLAGVAFLFYVPTGILLGLIAALRRNTWIDQAISVGSLTFIGLPEFVSAMILISIFSIELGWLPSQSSVEPGAGFLAEFPKLILPAITVALTSLAYIVRMTRSSTVDVLQTDYVRTANLKGLPPYRVLFTHVLRNSLLPTVTVVAIGVGWLLGGLIITESVFSYPGIGRLLLFAIQRRDLPLIQATTLLVVLIYSVSNLIADVLYAVLNPRIRYN